MTTWRAVFIDPWDACRDAGVFVFDLPDEVDPLDEAFQRAPKGFAFSSVEPLMEYDDAFIESVHPEPTWGVDQGDEREEG